MYDSISELEEKEICTKISELIKTGNSNEAYKLTLKYTNSSAIQALRMTILIKNGEYRKAEVIGNKEKFKNSALVQSQIIKIAAEHNDWGKINEIGNSDKFINNPTIQSQILKLAIRKRNMEKIKEIEDRSEFLDKQVIQEQIIRFEIKQGNLEEAKKRAERRKYINNPTIQRQMIEIALLEGDLQKVKEIGNRATLKKYESIKFVMKKVLSENPQLDDNLIQEKQKIENEEPKKENEKKDEKVIEKINTEQQEINQKKKESININRTKVEFRERIKEKKVVAKKTDNTKQKDLSTDYNEYVKRIIYYLEKDKIDTYVRMQSNDDEIRRNAIQRWDKIEILIERLKESMIIIRGNDTKNKKTSEEFLKKICEKFEKIEHKLNQMDDNSR